MIRPLILSLAALAASAALAADIVGSGQVRTESRDAHGFHGVALDLSARVEITQGNTESVSVSADDNLLPYIETRVENGILHVRLRDDTSIRARSPIKVAVTAREVDALNLAGSGDIVAPRLDGANLALKISGSGRARIGGHVQSLEASISGSGDLHGEALKADQAQVRISGSGRAVVAPRKTLMAHISGSGSVDYYGDPAVERRISGSGRVKRVGDAPA